LRPCLPKGPINSARMLTIVTAALQRQYLQTDLILWIRLVVTEVKQKVSWRWPRPELGCRAKGKINY
jgi:hypothetical protein